MNHRTTEPAAHLSADELLAYWLHETDEAATARVDVHLLRCDACGALLDELLALRAGVQAGLKDGSVSASVGEGLLRLASERGWRVREYRVPRNGAVNCTVAPDDDLVLSRLQVPLAGVDRLDAVFESSLNPGQREWQHDLPFDAQAGEVLQLQRVDELKRAPDHEARVTLLSIGAGGPRELGRYTFHHRAWPGRA